MVRIFIANKKHQKYDRNYFENGLMEYAQLELDDVTSCSIAAPKLNSSRGCNHAINQQAVVLDDADDDDSDGDGYSVIHITF